MTEKERELRMSMLSALKALWPLIVPFVIVMMGFFGSLMFIIYSRAEFAVALARETDKNVVANYVTKTDAQYEYGRINGKLDYLIQMHLNKK